MCALLSFRMDATLRELATLVKEVNPDARRKGTYIDFNVVFPHAQQGKYLSREIGSICVGMFLKMIVNVIYICCLH